MARDECCLAEGMAEMRVSRRGFMKTMAGATALAGFPALTRGVLASPNARSVNRILFTSQGKTGMVRADGSGLRYFDFHVPNQATWQPCGFFSDGRRILFLSMEPRRDGPGRPFDQFYHQTPTHLWVHDLENDTLTEVATRDRMAVFYTPQLILSEERLLVQVIREGVGQIFSMNLDGSDAREFTRAGEGLPYGFDLSPDGKRVAYHLASPTGYQIWTSDVDGGDRTLVAADPEHLFFCPAWSPDGQWLAFQDCLYRSDPGHDWSDLSLCRPDGSELRRITQGQALWFSASYGTPENRGGGSNTPTWSHDGSVLCAYRLPGTKVPWVFQSDRPDTDHFNRAFHPEQAVGGTRICRIEPRDGSVKPLTSNEPPVWDFRQSESPDGQLVVFCRAETGGVPSLWVMERDGSDPRLLSKGLEDRGLDHPRWWPLQA